MSIKSGEKYTLSRTTSGALEKEKKEKWLQTGSRSLGFITQYKNKKIKTQ
jgi:hypothetical protein